MPDAAHVSDHQTERRVELRVGSRCCCHPKSLTYKDIWCKLNIYEHEAIATRRWVRPGIRYGILVHSDDRAFAGVARGEQGRYSFQHRHCDRQ